MFTVEKMSPGHREQVRVVYRALADRTRRRLLNLMAACEVCVCFFVEVLGESRPKISRHLAYLRRAGVVAARGQVDALPHLDARRPTRPARLRGGLDVARRRPLDAEGSRADGEHLLRALLARAPTGRAAPRRSPDLGTVKATVKAHAPTTSGGTRSDFPEGDR